MTPKDKAEELVNNYTQYLWAFNDEVIKNQAKKCAFICVEEIIKTIFTHKNSYDYWQQVKTEIENL